MLEQAADKLADNHFDDYVTWLWATAETLPFDDDSFDLVTCLEALEFMPEPERVLAECCRVLRPGGILMTTRRVNTIWFFKRVWSRQQMQTLLENQAMEAVKFLRWQIDYEQVWARKAGDSSFVGVRMLDDVLRCPVCGVGMIGQGRAWRCLACDAQAQTDEHGIIHLFPLQGAR